MTRLIRLVSIIALLAVASPAFAAKYLGDFPEDHVGVQCHWDTNAATGASITRATDGTVSVYKDGGLTQSTAGITNDEDFDALTGTHLVTIDTSADAFYAAGSEYAIVLSGASIDSQTVNATLCQFSIERAGGVLALLKGANGLSATKTVVDAVKVTTDKVDDTLEDDGGTFRFTTNALEQSPAGTDLTIARSGTAQAGGATTIRLDSSASAVTDFYKYQLVGITSGTGAGQARFITAYNGTTKDATVGTAWATNPDSTSVFAVLHFGVDIADTPANFSALVIDANGRIDLSKVNGTSINNLVSGRMDSSVGAMAADTVTATAIATGAITNAKFAAGAIDAAAVATDAIGSAELSTAAALEIGQNAANVTLVGTAQAGAAGSITLPSAAVGTDDYYNNQIIVITGGTGAGQSRFVSDYTGATEVATVSPNWSATPDNTSTVVLLGFSSIPGATAPTVAEIRTELDTNSTKLDVAVSTRLAPTTAGRTLDVTATGAAGVDWANVEAPTTTVNLSGTTISTSQAVASVSGAVGSVTSVGAGGITASSFGANAVDATALASNAAAEIGDDIQARFPTNFAAGIIGAGGQFTAGGTIRRNTASQTYPIYLVASNDHITPATGKTVTVQASKDGAAFGDITGSVAEIASGWYLVTLSAADTDCDTCVYRATATATDTRPFYFKTAP